MVYQVTWFSTRKKAKSAAAYKSIVYPDMGYVFNLRKTGNDCSSNSVCAIRYFGVLHCLVIATAY